jgi:hypothetical protein
MAKQFRWLGHQIAGWRKGPFSHWEKGRACTREGGCLRMNGEAWPEPAGGAGAKFKALAN